MGIFIAEPGESLYRFLFLGVRGRGQGLRSSSETESPANLYETVATMEISQGSVGEPLGSC